MTPRPPQDIPRQRAPSAPAASSISATSGETAVCNASQSSGRPKRWTAITARVRSVTASYTRAGSTFIVRRSTSTSTGRAPASTTAFAVAGKVYAGTITSSPSPSPSAATARWTAAVPEETATACSVPQASARTASNSATFGPIVR